MQFRVAMQLAGTVLRLVTVPQGRPKIAQRFIAGLCAKHKSQARSGAKENALSIAAFVPPGLDLMTYAMQVNNPEPSRAGPLTQVKLHHLGELRFPTGDASVER